MATIVLVCDEHRRSKGIKMVNQDVDQFPRDKTSSTPSDIFDVLWSALVEILGSPATATLLRRSAKRRLGDFPELGKLAITRKGFEYAYAVPADWKHANERSNPALQLESTGDDSFDAILGGGIPSQSVVVIAGEPGSGKTVLTLQILFRAARQGKKCLYFTTLAEPAIKVIRYMQLFDFFDAALVDKQIMIADLTAAVRKGADGTLTELSAMIEKHQPAFVAIDSFRAIADHIDPGNVARSFVYDLATQMAGWGVTTLLVGEYVPDEFSKYAEFAIADGILRLGSEKQELTSVRELEVLKLRGMDYEAGIHFLEISEKGAFVFPRVRAPKQAEVPRVQKIERVSTGLDGLDELFCGGIPRDGCTLIQGATGTGKTILSLQFLLAGARQGEKGVLFTLEETPNQLRT